MTNFLLFCTALLSFTFIQQTLMFGVRAATATMAKIFLTILFIVSATYAVMYCI